MPFNIIITPDEEVEASIGEGSVRRLVAVECSGAPWPRTVLTQPLITAALEAWMRSSPRPRRVNWSVVDEMLETAGLGELLRPRRGRDLRQPPPV